MLDRGATVVAGRLAGAFRHVGRDRIADEIVRTMQSAHHQVRESNPFDPADTPVAFGGTSPLAGRIAALWEQNRQIVIDVFPQPPGLPDDIRPYLDRVDEVYVNDAYHSLSIEGYAVSPELIEKVRNGEWNPSSNEADRQNENALAARGHWESFQLVKDAVRRILEGGDAASIVADDHGDWYRALFAPKVMAGLLQPRDLAGYRTHPVYLMTSDYVPPRHEAVMDGMTALFEQIKTEPEPSVRAVLGHWLFGFVHPYPDGNGRTARFLLNALLASGGYPWTIVWVEDRQRYLAGLNSASLKGDAGAFVEFMTDRVVATMQEEQTSEPRHP